MFLKAVFMWMTLRACVSLHERTGVKRVQSPAGVGSSSETKGPENGEMAPDQDVESQTTASTKVGRTISPLEHSILLPFGQDLRCGEG